MRISELINSDFPDETTLKKDINSFPPIFQRPHDTMLEQKLLSSAESLRRFICTQPNCGKAFTRRYNLSAHLRCHRCNLITKKAEKPFVCPQCPCKFARKHDCTRHIRSIHELRRSYGPCPYCQAYFTRSDALSRHVKIEQEKNQLAASKV